MTVYRRLTSEVSTSNDIKAVRERRRKVLEGVWKRRALLWRRMAARKGAELPVEREGGVGYAPAAAPVRGDGRGGGSLAIEGSS